MSESSPTPSRSRALCPVLSSLPRWCALAAALLLVLPAGCGDGDRAPDLPVSAYAGSRSTDPQVVAARAALDHRRLAEARALVDEVALAAGTEEPLLRARLADMDGDLFEAVRLLRQAALERPGDPRPAAALVEIFAWRGRLDDAEAELDAARAAHGRVPELVRAHGVLGICTPGGARSGLELLLEAQRADPTLPFVARALGAAFLLASQSALRDGDVARAVDAARQAVEHAPEEPRAREALADALATGADLEHAVDLYESLFAEGLDVRVKLTGTLRAAATAAMVAALELDAAGRERTDADRERWYLRMCELGVARADLGQGRAFLQARARASVDGAFDALDSVATREGLIAKGYPAAELERLNVESRAVAAAAIERALVLDPHSFSARGLKGEMLLEQQRFTDAAVVFEGLCAEVGDRVDELPLALHIKAAEAWLGAGDTQRARDALLAYLAANPSGLWEDETHALLATIP
jgi:Flp pilus assembly protein TadD